MNRAEACALAEREIVEIAREGQLPKLMREAKLEHNEVGHAMAVLRGAIQDVSAQIQAERVDTGALMRLGALCIEALAACHLQHYNTRRTQDGPAA